MRPLALILGAGYAAACAAAGFLMVFVATFPARSLAVAVNVNVPTPFGRPPLTFMAQPPSRPAGPTSVAVHEAVGAAPSL